MNRRNRSIRMITFKSSESRGTDPAMSSHVASQTRDAAAGLPAQAVPTAERPHGQGCVHFSSRTDDWATPRELFDALNREFGFTLDPCSSHANAKCAKHFTVVEDGLAQDWSRDVVFMNPPYGRAIARWMEKAFTSSQAGATVVCLVPARTDTRWWHSFAIHGRIRFLRGRVRFGESKTGAPFPSAVVIFEPFTQATKTCVSP